MRCEVCVTKSAPHGSLHQKMAKSFILTSVLRVELRARSVLCVWYHQSCSLTSHKTERKNSGGKFEKINKQTNKCYRVYHAAQVRQCIFSVCGMSYITVPFRVSLPVFLFFLLVCCGNDLSMCFHSGIQSQDALQEIKWNNTLLKAIRLLLLTFWFCESQIWSLSNTYTVRYWKTNFIFCIQLIQDNELIVSFSSVSLILIHSHSQANFLW